MDQQNLLDLDGDSDGQHSSNNTLPIERSKHNSARSEDSEKDSEASSNEFVKFDEQELANLPASDFLAKFGNRVANDALDSALEGSRSDFYTQPAAMDERDLYVPEDAGKAEQHPQPHDIGDLDEFDPLAHQRQHNLDTVPEQRNVEFEEGQIASKPALPTHDDSEKKDEPEHPKPKEPETPVDNAGEEVIQPRHHSPLTIGDEDPSPQQNYNESDIHERVDDLLDEFESVPQPPKEEEPQKQPSPVPVHNEEQYSPSGDSGHDTLGELQNLNDNGLPASESVSSGMRDLSPELNTFERNGPLTFPTSTSHQQPSAPQPKADDFDDFPHQPPRPPTPPKDLNEEGEENPQSLDLGPPPPHSHLTHRTSEHGLHSILKHNSDKAWVDFRSIPQPVQEVLLWRDPKNSAIALAASLGALILFAKFTFISLLAWGALLVLGGTLGFRVFKLVESQVKKTDGSNPFKPYLEPEINVPQEKVHAQADVVVQHGVALVNQLRRLLFVENICDSVKFGVLLWTLTYVGAWFSGITLVTLFVLGLFSFPKIYELYKEPIDEYVGLARENVNKVNQIVQEKLPFLKQAEKVEKKE